MRFRCVVLSRRRILKISGAGALIFVIVAFAFAVSNLGKAENAFLNKDFAMQIVESEFPTDFEEKEDNHIKLIRENPIFSNYEKIEDDKTEIEKDEAENKLILGERKTAENSEPENTKLNTENKEEKSYEPTMQMSVRNETDFAVDLNEFSLRDLPFEKESAQVLIMHTHTTESYSSSSATKYSSSERGRTTNDEKNMTSIGKIVSNRLNENGIKTTHDTTVHDYPTYNNAYTRALTTIEKNLKKNPKITIVLDFHRDAFAASDQNTSKLTTKIADETAAQIMIVAGTDKNGLRHDGWQGNLVFAAKLQKKANEMYPGLMRSLNLRKERFNQHLTPGSLIIEVGSNTNTLEEAKIAAEAFSDVIVAVLCG